MTVSTIKLKATNGGGSVALKGVATTSHEVELEMPADIGTADQVLKLTSISGKTGTLAWTTISTDPTTTSGTNNFTVADGNLVIGTGGHGIDFSAQTATSATDSTTTSELFDHYEEGTWTPVPKISHVTTGITAGVSGTYTRIGRLVHISFKVVFSDKGSNGGQFTVHGLPFAENGEYIASSSTGGGGFCFYQTGLAGLTVDGNMTFRAESSMLYMQVLNADNLTVIPAGSELADDTTIYGHGWYYA